VQEPRAASRGISWYLRRLALMQPREIVHRFAEQARLQRMRLEFSTGATWSEVASAPAFAFCRAESAQLPEPAWDEALLAAERDALLRAAPGALGFDWQHEGESSWHVAPDTGRAWPRGFFGGIDYRGGNPSGDARVVWEPSRLQWLVGLALIARRQADPRARSAADMLERLLLSWMAANPPLTGVHYVSSMECALRLIAVVHALDLARASLPRDSRVWPAVVQLAAAHAGLIERRLSLHSSAGNHTVAEAAGLVYAGVLFPELPAARRWRETGLALLAAELPRQVLADGGGAEQATGYLWFVGELAALVQSLLIARNLPVPVGLQTAVTGSAAFLLAMAAGGKLPFIGDYDDGRALARWMRPYWQPPGATVPAARATFPEAGYTVLRSAAADWHVIVDHGSLGMLPACGHGHADALAVLLQVDGKPVLLDTGTFTYSGEPQWRAWFRSTAAHNTVSINGQDQAEQRTAFQWAGAFSAECVRVGSANGVHRLLARHDGYRARTGVRHWRGVALHDDGFLVVWDRLDGSEEADIGLHWHLPAAEQAEPGTWRSGRFALEVRGSQAVRCVTGSGSPPGGWYSARYGRKEPVSSLLATWSGSLPHELITCIDSHPRRVSEAVVRDDIEQFRQWMQ